MVGMKFGTLTVIGKTKGPQPIHDTIWNCRCKCGKSLQLATAKLLTAEHHCTCVWQKTCDTCGKSMPEQNFAKRKDGRSPTCKSCSAKQRAARRKTTPVTRVNLRAPFWTWYTTGCQACGETDTVCLSFHHLDPNMKTATISSMWESDGLVDELAKCAVLCRNCHARVHAGQIDGSTLKPIDTTGFREIVTRCHMKLAPPRKPKTRARRKTTKKRAPVQQCATCSQTMPADCFRHPTSLNCRRCEWQSQNGM